MLRLFSNSYEYTARTPSVCVVYLDDIVIFSRDADKHADHLRQVLRILQDNKVACKHWRVTSFKHQWNYPAAEGIKPCPKRVSAIKNWPVPKDKRSLQVLWAA